jgi:nicotinamidase-related amidase
MDLPSACRGAYTSSLPGVIATAVSLLGPLMLATVLKAEESFALTLQSQVPTEASDGGFAAQHVVEAWPASATAVIVCDVWDYHHCLNAVRRLEEFAPRLDAVIAEARRRGATIIHAPSDCMAAYADHPCRQRAIAVPAVDTLPDQIESWCSAIPAEESVTYPIDQSDGGEDDAPEEHAAWAAKLEALGRNPRMPWQQQSPLISINEQTDFITDRGDEVWNILAARGIDNVILTGVHVNMCVLGRPFGLRQLARHGKHVVLMRDMTDSMYNPARWPFVSHFEGTRRVIDHIERHICPTITSDQILGGMPFRFAADQVSSSRPSSAADAVAAAAPWQPVEIPAAAPPASAASDAAGKNWYRCTVFLPSSLLVATGSASPQLVCGDEVEAAWLNGEPLPSTEPHAFVVVPKLVASNDVNLLVLQTHAALRSPPVLQGSEEQRMELAGRWQRLVDDVNEPWSMPLPAKFGAPPEILVSP